MATQRTGFKGADVDVVTTGYDVNNGAKAVEAFDEKPAFNEVTKDASSDSEKGEKGSGEGLPAYEGEGVDSGFVPATAEEIVKRVIDLDDDPSLNPWTFRMMFIGLGLSIFGSVLQEIFYFKPQTIFVSVVFLTVLGYILGEGMAFIIPRKGRIGLFLNPFPFNMKEHASITLMASAAAQAALSTEALAAQDLFYGGYPSKAAGIFITLSSQLIGFGLAGMLRDVLVYPTHMLWPSNLPVTSLIESLHGDKFLAKHRLKIFYIIFFIMLVWELFPEYIFTVLEGVSIFCLAHQDSLVFTSLFGGASGNEGLGILAFCFDWNFIAGLGSPLWYPLNTLVNSCIGYVGCVILFMALYYTNTFRAQDFPFLAQQLFDGSSNSTNFVIYNQTQVLNADFEIDQALLSEIGTPFLTASYIGYLITTNMGFTATFVHMLLWNWDDLKAGWSWAAPSNIRKVIQTGSWKFWANQETPEERLERKQNDPNLDPHYKLMLRNLYREVPIWWWAAIVTICWIVGIVCLYIMKSTLPWWGFILSTLFTALFLLFFGAQQGITGFGFNLQPICQMLAGYLFPGKPLANLYFTCYTFNATSQGQLLARDLKLAQYVHLSPRNTFFVQLVGCLVGALMNYVMMITIVDNQTPILLGIDGSNIWSGQNVQQFNTLAFSWSMPKELFSVGGRYEWVTLSFLVGFLVPLPFYFMNKIFPHPFFRFFNMSIILWYMGWLFVGINSSITMYFLIGFVAQYYLRKYRPDFFVKYNYIVSAALDGGTQVMVFILTFAVFGGSGVARPFPIWAGNPDTSIHNLDYCMVNPALG